MPDPLDRLLDAHVQHELASWQGAALSGSIDRYVQGLFRWFAGVKLSDVLTKAQIAGVIERYVIDLRVSGGITELSGEIARLVFTSEATASARLDQILPPQMYQEFADKVLALEGVRRELLELIANSASVRSLSARLIARSVLDLVALAVPLPNRLIPAAQTSVSTRAAETVRLLLEQLAEKALAHHHERLARAGAEPLVELIDPERLRSIVDELWDRVSSMRLDEVFALVQEQDIEDFVVLVYEFWLRYRKTDFFRRVTLEAIDHFFTKYGEASLLAVVDDMGVTERMVAAEAHALLRPMLEHALASGALERGIRQRLEAFYRSSEARAVFENR